MRKVIRGYAKDKNLNLILIGTIPVPHSKDKRSPAARQNKRYLVRQGATIFKKETEALKMLTSFLKTTFRRSVQLMTGGPSHLVLDCVGQSSKWVRKRRRE
jgi:hypothetical protein